MEFWLRPNEVKLIQGSCKVNYELFLVARWHGLVVNICVHVWMNVCVWYVTVCVCVVNAIYGSAHQTVQMLLGYPCNNNIGL